AGLLQDDAAVFRIGEVAEIGALIEEAFTLGVDHDAVEIAVAKPVVARLDAAEVAGVALPGARMAARPLAVGLRADVERHADAVAGVEAGAAHLCHVPAGAEIARPPFAVGFEAAARQHHGVRREILRHAIDLGAHAFDATRSAQQRDAAGAIAHVNAEPFGVLEVSLHQAFAAAVGIYHRAEIGRAHV